ncbi:Drug/Metabolite Transporter (DMT) Superfamily [Thraustotheca clavata]|uniref:Drug/Metabolite Transporter (DMT) Superfamily n=1 Tax=Thraustotheca clavata TaxID=74557 RepID=A0A1V9YWL4_9STRA|nr:Drug/Metabolite Transporter (DMT) Superfamily [Thraustotheca clavata]
MDIQACLRNHRILLLGQSISLFITATSVCTQELTLNYGVQLATTQNVGNYFLLIGYLMHLWWTKPEYRLETPWWQYALIALADVEGNFLTVLAYKYTTITSVMLLDCFTLPVVMFLSINFLDAKYTKVHFTGVILCLCGIAMLMTSDIFRAQDVVDATNVHALFGDMLCLMGSTIYAISNVAQEHYVKTKSRKEFLGMLGIFGFLLSATQAYFYEKGAFLAITWTTGSVVYFAGYVLGLFLMYSVTSVMLREGDAAIFNMSLLTSDFFGVVAGVCLFHQTLSMLYIAGFFFIISGLIVYSRAPPPTARGLMGHKVDDATIRLLPDIK